MDKSYTETFLDEPPLAAKLAALDALAEPPRRRLSVLDVELAVIAALMTVAYYYVVFSL